MPKRVSKAERRSVGEWIALRLRDVREAKGWSQAELAAALTDLGTPVHQTAIAKIESGNRKVAVDELLRLALALGVSPAHLVAPQQRDAEVEVAPGRNATGTAVREWMAAIGPFEVVTSKGNDHIDNAAMRFFLSQRSDEELSADPLIEAVRGWLAAMHHALATPDDRDRITALLDEIIAGAETAKALLALPTRPAR